jgi:hypothetical protein
MGWGIGLGRDWLSGRYAVPFVYSCVRRGQKEAKEEKNIPQEDNSTIPQEQEEERPHSLTQLSTISVSAPTAHARKPPSTASNSSAKTSGPCSSASRSTT